MFQFLIGWLQTHTFLGNHTIGWVVSIPYRLATNNLFKFYSNYSRNVSIPYRLATNRIRTGWVPFPCAQFQFLIGWLQTREACRLGTGRRLVSIPYRLATNSAGSILLSKVIEEFQFLIGWLQTMQLVHLFYLIRKGFNSLQVGYKLGVWTKPDTRKEVFQFLIGWLQTLHLCFYTPEAVGFNSLQVGYKPSIIE